MSDEEIAAAEQRGREDNADHGMCYVYGSKALEAILDERDSLRQQLEVAKACWKVDMRAARSAEAKVSAARAVADRSMPDYLATRPERVVYESDLRAALDGPQ